MKSLIFDALGAILSGTDFILKKSDDAFVRKFPGGRQELSVPILDYHPEYEFSLVVCIRLDAVEEVFHRFSGAPPKYQGMSVTTITQLQYFTGNARRFKVISEPDVASAVRSLAPIVRGEIIPFFDRYTDLRSLNIAVNCKHPGIDSTQYPSRAMHSVILARLAEDADFHGIVTRHRNEMQLPPTADHRFNQLVKCLEDM